MIVSPPSLDFVIRRARLRNNPQPVDIGIHGGRFVAIEPCIESDARELDFQGRLALPGFVETHIHLDKACLLGRCNHGAHASLADAIRSVSEMKRDFTIDDVYARGKKVLERAITQGTMYMRTHVEIDPRIGLRSFEAIRQLKRDYAWAIDLSICAFPQEGLTNDPGTDELLVQALEQGADALGGCPYTDTHPERQIERLFDLARRFDVDLDFHLDFDLVTDWSHLGEVCRQTERHGYQGRVAIGHVTKLSAMPPALLASATKRLADSGVALTVLPATDTYLMGRDATHNAPRGLTKAHRLSQAGVRCSIATNNVLNPFTPFGDCSLLRMANFYANIAHAGVSDFETCLDLITSSAASLMNIPEYGFVVGNPANLILVDAENDRDALAEIPDILLGMKNGGMTFERGPARLIRPGANRLPKAI